MATTSISSSLPQLPVGSQVVFSTSGSTRTSADVSIDKKNGLQRMYLDMLHHKSFDEVLKVIENDKLHYEIPKPKSSLDYQQLFQNDKHYIIVYLRDIAQTIQERLRRDWTVDEFLACFRAYLRSMGLPMESMNDESAKQRNGFSAKEVSLTLVTRVCGESISRHTIKALHVLSICHVPMNLVIMVHFNRPPPITAADIACSSDLDMFQDLLSTMQQISASGPQHQQQRGGTTTPPMIGLGAIFDTQLGKIGGTGNQVRTFACRLSDNGQDMFTLFDGMSDDIRVREHMELVMSDEHKEAMSRQPEYEKEVREKKKRVYEENMKKEVIKHNVLISHGGVSVQRILFNQEETWNAFLDSQIKFLQDEVTRLRQEREEMHRRNQEVSRKRPPLPPPRFPSVPPAFRR